MESIIKQFVTFEQACDLVKLGFKEDCLSIFSDGVLECIEDNYCLGQYGFQFNDDPEDILIAPTYQQAFDFIYEKYGVHWSLCESSELDFNIYHYNSHLYSSQKFEFDIKMVDDFYTRATFKSGLGFKSIHECRSAALTEILDRITNNRIYDAS
jgi:hypothetical protein